ncbi:MULTISPECIES: MFS transporter [Actibacterium]|uniref:MFS-type drug efflux transporter P55 n=1 Tax=Actibacterium naphthalenivorans TaxID=1614693 RepID=A0A840CDN4_9RHOB|nr:MULTISPECIES: MFS transporter [Actibacterium]ALG90280.1 multidrug MFS transporter [Actibacterium sp. EMB200-NS6]MBB4022192.1 DHA1 family bicyclomycin/chloramphenicol resistance-like MFS transporter [Actibacterium naphthalenivorans]
MNAPTQRLGQTEFIAMIAMMFATIAFSIDAMLPALPVIGQELSPGNLNRAQLIITSFVFGMGIGTLMSGPLSDAFGRRPVIIAGAGLYIVGACLAWAAGSLEMVLAARVLQGLGAAGPRVVSLAVVRDLYSGRDMARITSFVMMIFTLLPALAPTVGAGVILFTGWRGIFAVFVLFSVVSVGWFSLRQPETLLPARRRPLQAALLIAAAKEVFSRRLVTIAIIVQTLIFATLFMMISSTQQIFDLYFGKSATFPLWFGFIAIVAGTASVANAQLVGRLGMRFLIRNTLNMVAAGSAIMLIFLVFGLWPDWAEFPAYVVFSIAVFGTMGLTIGNLNALAMEPLGHIAGMAASVIGAVATVLSVVIAAPVGLAFDGTPVPLATGIFLAFAIARLAMLWLPND